MEAYPSVRNSRRFDIPINIQMFLHFRNFYTSTAVRQHRTPIIIVVVRKTGKVVGWISYLRMGVFYTNFSTRFPNFLISCKSEPLILLIMLVFLFITYHSVPKYNDSCFQHWCTNALLIFREIVVGVLYYIILYTWYYVKKQRGKTRSHTYVSYIHTPEYVWLICEISYTGILIQ